MDARGIGPRPPVVTYGPGAFLFQVNLQGEEFTPDIHLAHKLSDDLEHELGRESDYLTEARGSGRDKICGRSVRDISQG